jgi:hypothetical protein
MKWLFPLVGLVMMVVAIWGLIEARTPDVHTRQVAFDNTYGDTTQLQVYVEVDESAVQPVTAICDETTCIFDLPLTDARHTVELSVEQNGKRSAPTRVTLDTTSLKER